MTFYAQHGEDKRLRDFFPNKNDGFYIDVGAWHPHIDSVTKHFYDAGWSGINCEPVKEYYDLLKAERGRDINLQVAVGDIVGFAPMVATQGSGLSTLDKRFGSKIPIGFNAQSRVVAVSTLTRICRNNLPRTKDIDFLKVDVEGWEEQVLRGMNWAEFRPRVLCIEATEPCSTRPNWGGWFDYIQDQGYTFLEFDGLNMWFCDSRISRPG